MRPAHCLVLLAFLFLGLAPVPFVAAAEWRLVWSDEFDGSGLPDAAKWDYEQGYIRNHEAQFYTRERVGNARLENGLIVLEARKERLPIAPGTLNAGGRDFTEYTAASLHTHGKFSVTFGRIEMRAKLPHGRGVWPAFWMLGDNIGQVGWPACGEIDVMELVGKEPDRIYGTAHWQADGKPAAQGNHLQVEGTDDQFHVYAVEWTSKEINFQVDGQVYNRVLLDPVGTGVNNPFRKPHYLLLNFALGGDWGGPIDDVALPQRYLIDYVRVYQRKE